MFFGIFYNQFAKTNYLLLLLFFAAFSTGLVAQKTVTGRVTIGGDSVLPGATVQVKGGNEATQTDASGFYSISVQPNGTLVFSFVGSIPPGTLNILVLQLGLENKVRTALLKVEGWIDLVLNG